MQINIELVNDYTVNDRDYENLRVFVSRHFDSSITLERNLSNFKTDRLISKLLRKKFENDLVCFADFIRENSQIVKFLRVTATVEFNHDTEIKLSDDVDINNIDSILHDNFKYYRVDHSNPKFNQIKNTMFERIEMGYYQKPCGMIPADW